MIGHQEVSVFVMFISFVPLVIVMTWPVPDIVRIMLIASIIFTVAAVFWPNYLISVNRLQPLINRINPETEEVWVRVTKNKLLTFQLVKRGVYGQTKGVMYNEKADVIDKGDFPIRLMNGNHGILVYDKISKNVNLDEAISWKQIEKKHKTRSGEETYRLAKTKEKTST